MMKNVPINSFTKDELNEYILDLGEKIIEPNKYGNGYMLTV